MPQIKLRYFGISAFEVTSEKGVRVLIDPCITELRGTKISPVGLEAFPKLDVILVSHSAADHLGDTLELVRQTGCDVMAAGNVATYLARKGVDPQKILLKGRGLSHRRTQTSAGKSIRCCGFQHVSGKKEWVMCCSMHLCTSGAAQENVP